MSERTVEIDAQENDPMARVKMILKDQYSCYVLITCTAPCKEGNMNVAMNFEGDEDLASLLIENASQVFEARIPRRESK
ncbi:MAG TPA: hypothetical protein VLE96_04460 [Chlamydiales bacterium]|nr:hypothetical protein [Chlamydiales bacterium]